jgi:8-oxo-dGTP pyrophosphatase MutT (NUDIX family)
VYQAIPTDHAPELVLVEPPPVPAEIAALQAHHHERLLARPAGYDGPAWICRDVSKDVAHIYEAPYSLYLALREEGSWPIGRGIVLAKVLLDDGAGEYLWQLRSEKVLAGNHWSWSAAGGVDPGETVHEGAAREMREEIGLDVDVVADLRVVALLDGNGLGLSVLFRGRIDRDTELELDTDEVARMAWAPQPMEPPTNTISVLWPELVRLGVV